MNSNSDSRPTYIGWKKVLLWVIVFSFSACSLPLRTAGPAYQTHESGIKYLVTEKGDGAQASIKDKVRVHYRLLLEDSTLIESSYDRSEPVSFQLGQAQVIKGWDIGIELLQEGDKATLIIPPDLGYGDKPMGDIPANSTLVFHVELIEVLPAPDPYVVPEGVEISEVSSGLRYAVIEGGEGKQLQPGMKVKVHYSGYFENMEVFDSSYERGYPFEFTLGRGMVIRGWEEGIARLRVGDKARLWIPWDLAYGQQGRGPIPPESNLIFDIEVLDAHEIARPEAFDVSHSDTLTTESGLQYLIAEEGYGGSPENEDIVTVHYTGYLPDGRMFDSSVQRGQVFRFVLGQGQVIDGWDEGVQLMQYNAKYRFIIPPELGYGDRRVGPIPPNSKLIFDIELFESNDTE